MAAWAAWHESWRRACRTTSRSAATGGCGVTLERVGRWGIRRSSPNWRLGSTAASIASNPDPSRNARDKVCVTGTDAVHSAVHGDPWPEPMGTGETVGQALTAGLKFAGAVAVVMAAGDAAFGGRAGITEDIAGRQVTIQSAHGARHLAGTGLRSESVETAIRAQVQQATQGASATGNFWGRVAVEGQMIEYRAFALPKGTINVGTYYPVTP